MLGGHYCQILIKYDLIASKYDQNDQTHVDFLQERHFLEIKKSNANNDTGWGGIGVLLIALTQGPY